MSNRIGVNLLRVFYSAGIVLLLSCSSGGSSTGNHCDASGRDYISRDVQRCAVMRFKCDSASRPFSDQCGCGCEAVKERPVAQFTQCGPSSRNADACIQIYKPVCGWKANPDHCFSSNCKSSYANSCFACADEHVVGYTSGACPN